MKLQVNFASLFNYKSVRSFCEYKVRIQIKIYNKHLLPAGAEISVYDEWLTNFIPANISKLLQRCFLGWYDVSTSHIAKSALKQRCVCQHGLF